MPEVKVSNFAYENVGDLEYRNVTEEWGMRIPSYSNGASFVDLDNDGDLDYVVNNINDKAFVYRNNTESLSDNSNYLKIKLEGEGQNSQAIGAKIELWDNGRLTFYEHFLSRGYISSVEPLVHFGLADTNADSLIITWPLGTKRTVLNDLKSNQVITAREADASDWSPSASAKEDYLFS